MCTAFQTWGRLCPRPYLYIDILISQSRLEHGQRKLGSNFRVTNDFLLGAIDYDEGW